MILPSRDQKMMEVDCAVGEKPRLACLSNFQEARRKRDTTCSNANRVPCGDGQTSDVQTTL
jgi:hypothetical protein